MLLDAPLRSVTEVAVLKMTHERLLSFNLLIRVAFGIVHLLCKYR
jgi:hypothetical protein